nr:heavy metal-binding domain-containing protein [Gluconobacter potus]
MGIFDQVPGFDSLPPGWGGSGASQPAQGGEVLPVRASGGRVATSDFSVRELLVVEQAGFRALGLCLGNSIWKVQANTQFRNTSYELTDLTGAMYGAREKAVEIMREEAEQLGADGIVGTRLEISQLADSGMLEFRAFGTAIVHAEASGVSAAGRTAVYVRSVGAGFCAGAAVGAAAAGSGSGVLCAAYSAPQPDDDAQTGYAVRGTRSVHAGLLHGARARDGADVGPCGGGRGQ